MGPLSWAIAASAAPTVALSRDRWLTYASPPVAAPEAAPGPFVARRDVTLEPRGADLLEVRARWTVAAPSAGRLTLRLAGPGVTVEEVRVDGVPARTVPNLDGPGTFLAARVDRPLTVELRGVVALGAGAADVELLGATAGTVRHPRGTAIGGAIPLDRTTSLGAAERLSFAPTPPTSPDRDLVLGESALGVTVGDAEITVRGTVRFVVAGRPIERVSFSAAGAGADLDVRGPQVASWRLEGDRVEVALREPEASLVAVEVSWTAPTPRGEASTFALPRLVPEGVFKASSAVQVARESDLDVIADLDGWSAVAPADLPAWGRNLVAGTPVGAFTGRGDAGQLTVLRFAPVDGPATIVDVASYAAALTEEGRVLLRATYAVRNDRGAHLRVAAPAGLRPIGAKVSGKTATVSRDDDAWLVPLEKSVETVEGLLAFPVEVLFVGEIADLDLRKGGAVPLPTVDAEVAVARLSLSLPRDWERRVEAGEGEVVEGFTAGESLTYGYAVGDARAAQADVLFQQAVDAWKQNDFRGTGERLDQLRQMGASNEDISRLESNVRVVSGGASGAVERRVLEQARARALDDELAQQEELKKADEAYASGDYDAAEEAYTKALTMGEDLAKLRSAEDLGQVQVNREVVSKLEGAKRVRAQKDVQSQSNVAEMPPPPPPALPEPEEPVFEEGVVARIFEREITVPAEGGERVPLTQALVDEVRAGVNGPTSGQRDFFGTTADGERVVLPPEVVDFLANEDLVVPSEEPKPDQGGVLGGVVGGDLGGVAGLGGFGVEGTGQGGGGAADGAPAPVEDLALLGYLDAEQDARVDEFGIVLDEDEPAPVVEYYEEQLIDTESTTDAKVLDREFLQRIPAGRTYQSAVQTVPGVQDAPDPAPAAAPPKSKARSVDKDAVDDVEPMKAEKPRPTVTASALGVVLPSGGDVVYYQHLLLPAGAPWEVAVRARPIRRRNP